MLLSWTAVEQRRTVGIVRRVHQHNARALARAFDVRKAPEARPAPAPKRPCRTACLRHGWPLVAAEDGQAGRRQIASPHGSLLSGKRPFCGHGVKRPREES